MTAYIPVIIMVIVYLCLVLLILWTVGIAVWILFGDMILHYLRVREVRKKMKK